MEFNGSVTVNGVRDRVTVSRSEGVILLALWEDTFDNFATITLDAQTAKALGRALIGSITEEECREWQAILRDEGGEA